MAGRQSSRQKFVAAPGAPQLLGRDGTQNERVGRGDGPVRGVGDPHRVRVGLAGGGQAHPKAGRPLGVQRDAVPGERQGGLAWCVTGRPDEQRLHGGVEEGWVQRETGCVGLVRLPQRDFGEHLLASAPDRAEALEGRPVVEPAGGELLVPVAGPQGHRTVRRPAAESGRVVVGGTRSVGQQALGMPRPGRVGRGLAGPGVHAERPASLFVGIVHDELDAHRAAFRQHERGLQGEFGELVAAGVVAGPYRHVDIGGGGQDDVAEDRVTGQPGVAPQRDAARERDGVRAGEGESRPEQRVVGLAKTDRVQVADPAVGRPPVAPALEGVGGQVDVAGGGEQGRPVEFGAPHEHSGRAR